ncbi:MAG: hypothetical protein K2P54_10265 [Odoribacter sp.]|nr:hypothetical protein [Odoribacter sp.]
MKKHDRLSVLKEPIPLFLLLLNILLLVIILCLSYSLYYKEGTDKPENTPATELPEEGFPSPEDLPV